jgi:GAF domain-containing protein
LKRAAVDLHGIAILNELDNQYLGKKSIDLLQRIMNAAIGIVEADKGMLQLLDSKSSALVTAVQRGFDELLLKFDDAGAIGAAMQSKKQVVIADALNSNVFAGRPSQEALIQAGIRGVISTPLIGGKDTFLGMISMYFCQPHHPDSRELHLIEMLSQQVACHLELMHAEQIESILYREVQHRSNNSCRLCKLSRGTVFPARARWIKGEGRSRGGCRHWRALIGSYSNRTRLGSVCARL